MSRRTWIAATLLLAACAKNDLGTTCVMQTSCDGGACALASDRVGDDQIDYLSLGISECADLACLRTKGSDNPAMPDGTATGYCSAQCLDDNDCKPSSSVPKMTCQTFIQTQSFLAADDLPYPQGTTGSWCARARTP